MYGDLVTMKKYWKQAQVERVTVDQKVCNQECYLYYARLVADTTGAATGVLRDGHDADGEAKLDIAALTSSYDQVVLSVPMHFKHGLFVDVGDNVTSITVHFLKGRD